jgi:hypothetical protein
MDRVRISFIFFDMRDSTRKIIILTNLKQFSCRIKISLEYGSLAAARD